MEEKEMDSILENSCTYTEKVLTEMYRRLMRKRLVIVFLIWLVFIGTYILLVFEGEHDLIPDLCIAIVTVVLAIQLIRLPGKQAKTVVRKSKELYNSDQEDQTIFYEDHLWATNVLSKAEINLTYDQIKCIIETKNLYCISLKAKSMMLLDKHNFAKGTQQEFLTFLQSKNIPIKK